MTTLHRTTRALPTAPVGRINPLPPITSAPDVHQVSDLGPADEEMRANIRYGRVSSVLPYLLQDSYQRDRQQVEHSVLVLQNEHLRAEFMPRIGGRLWSLVDKESGRELLHRNPVFQPANLALRNAWLAGGVEWNIGTIGHSVHTCEPLHAARVTGDDGEPVLRMWEFERMRGVVYQIDAWLPSDSRALLVSVRIRNLRGHDVPMYWWSNIAVPQEGDVRVLAPADDAFQFTYDGVLRKVPVPGEPDITYPAREKAAADYFFDIPPGHRPWIAALDSRGTGLVQTSTAALRGRKLFRWGRGEGGRHWQRWLSDGRVEYLEIQAGLARTQLEHLRMPAGGTWAWVEAYGLLAADPVVVHGDDSRARLEAVESALNRLVTAEQLDEHLHTATVLADRAPDELLSAGSGWGALELLLGERDGVSPNLPGTPFPESTLTDEQAYWTGLLTGQSDATGGDPGTAPASYQIDRRWLPLLETRPTWSAALHAGVIHAANGDRVLAAQAWRTSLSRAQSPWAHRNLAALAHADGDAESAREHYGRALALAPRSLHLRREFVRVLLAHADHETVLALVDDTPVEQRTDGRLRLGEARAAVGVGDLDRAGAILDAGLVVADIREGEGSLHELWFAYLVATRARELGRPVDEHMLAEVRERSTVPTELDFRMFVDH